VFCRIVANFGEEVRVGWRRGSRLLPNWRDEFGYDGGSVDSVVRIGGEAVAKLALQIWLRGVPGRMVVAVVAELA
jgi:hypothetical protein